MKSAYGKNELSRFISNRYGESINLTPITEGMESQVFSFTHDNKEFVLRINPVIEGFRKDEYAYRHFSSSKIPIPKIIEYGTYSSKHAFCISEKASGITLQDADGATVNALLPDIADLWRSIGDVDISDTAGYGIFSATDGNAPFHTWQDYLFSIFDQRRYDWEKVKANKNVDAELVDNLKSTFLSLIKYCSEDRKLKHGDFGSNNVLIDEHIPKINAIIDWDNASYGDPFYDIAGAYFWRTWLMCMEK